MRKTIDLLTTFERPRGGAQALRPLKAGLRAPWAGATRPSLRLPSSSSTAWSPPAATRVSNGGARGLGRGVRHAPRAARAWRTEKPTVLLVTETNFWYLLIRLPFLPAKVASFLVEVLACQGTQSRRRRQLADSESGPARGKGAAGAGEARAGGGGQGTRAIVVFGLVWVLCFLYKRTRFKNTTSICVLCFPETQAARQAAGNNQTSQEECRAPGSPCRCS